MPGVHLRVACCFKPAARLDAARQIRLDHAGGEFRLAWIAGRRRGGGWSASEEEGVGLADEVQYRKAAMPDLSNQ